MSSRWAPAPRGGGPTIVAIATPAGEGALGIVRLSGGDVPRVARGFFRGALRARRTSVGLVHDGSRPLDQVVASFFAGPDTYTGEDILELTAHGSPYLLSRIVELAVRSGARLAEPGEFTRRAYLNGRMDLAQAEAVGLLIRSRTEAAARAAFEQLEGRLSSSVSELRLAVTRVLANVEAALDHPDEGLPDFDPGASAEALRALAGKASRLAETHRLGRLAAEGARVSIVGRPNAGKSSLLNALLGRDRAIVAPEPGTTRDTLEAAADFRGVRTVLVDTAGLRPAEQAGPVEREGMRRARGSLAAADAAVVVVDRSVGFLEEDRRIVDEAAAGGRPVIVALNKSDLPAARSQEPPGRSVEVSALRGDGVDRLAAALRDSLGGGGRAAEGEPIVVTLRHRQALEQTAEALRRASGVVDEGELAAVDLREALRTLGAIVGDTAPEEVLREIFSRFCVGK